MKARESTLLEYFDGPVKFVSPSFQRPYSWKRQRCDNLLRLVLPAPDAPPTDGPAVQELFFGAIVAMSLETAPTGARKLLLIDGTHRLLTALTLLLAIRDALAATRRADADALHAAFFEIRRADGHSALKFIAPRKDRGPFEALVRRREPPSPAAPILRAYRYFREAIADLPPACLAPAVQNLARHITFVALTLDRDEDPYPIFKLLSKPEEAFTQTGLDRYTQFSPDPQLMALVAGGESREVEFKERCLRPYPKPGAVASPCPPAIPCPSPEGSFAILRAISGFMNSPGGGTLLIGVRDDGSIRGIEDEYAVADRGKASWDGYQLYLSNMIRTRIATRNVILLYRISRHRAASHDVCMVKVSPATAPAYLDKHLYVRAGPQTVEMLGPDLVQYVSTRFAPTAKA
ncbi:MAG: DUF262 domain-containing protein [Kiritimatiellae bacterium]|nr:DUF262 domain-containing protein [Kiritimatiellia bacterium]